MDTQQSPKIPFYVQRPFGEKMNASFDFIKENWKVMLKYITYLILPVCLLQGLSMNYFMGDYFGKAMAGADPSNLGVSFWTNYGFVILFSIIGSVLVASVTYALVKLYNEREDGLNGVTFQDIKPLLFRNIGRLILLGLFCIGVTIVLGVLMYIFPNWLAGVIGVLLFLAIFPVAIPLSLWVPIYLFENIGLIRSLTKALRMGFATWGGIFGILFVMGLIASVVQGVFMTPWYVTVFVKMIFTYSDGGSSAEPSIVYNVFSYILAVLMLYGMYMSTVLSFMGLSYQYGHASEKLDGVTVEDGIDNFENL